MNYLMHAIGVFGAVALGWYAGHEPFSPLPVLWRGLIVAGGTASIFVSLDYFVRR